MRAAWMLPGALLLSLSLSGCLGIDNMHDLQAALGMLPAPASLPVPLARAQASLIAPFVGQVVAFTSVGSEVFQGRELDHAWDFGDGVHERGAAVTHRFARAGLFTVRLTVANEHGASDADELRITALDNRAPGVEFALPSPRALAGQELAFAAHAEDPEGQPVRLLWDFGDGATAITPEAKHAFAAGGRYLVTLRAEDPSGLAATVSRALPVDESFEERGHVALLQGAAHAVDVGSHATRVEVQLVFDSLLGTHGLAASLVDAQGNEVRRAVAEPPPLAQGPFRLVLEATADALAPHAPGAWSLVVTLTSGVQLDYDLSGRVEY